VVAADTEEAVNTRGFVRLPSQPSKISNQNSSLNCSSEIFEFNLRDDCDIGIGFLPAQKSVMQLFSQGPAEGFSLVAYIFIFCLTLRSLSQRRLQSSDLLVTLLKNEPSTAHVVSVIVDFVLLLKCT
jgi:hypothetical protein